MKVVDKHGSWFTNFSQFRMHDPMSDTYFESGEPTKATNTTWRENNKLTVKATDDEGMLVDDPDPVAGVVGVAEPAVELTKAKK